MRRLDPNQDIDIFHRLRVIMTDPTIIAKEWDINSKTAEIIHQKAIITQTHLIANSKGMRKVVVNIVALADKKISIKKARSVLLPDETLATQFELELENARVINEITALIVAGVMEVDEGINQSLLDINDLTNAQSDQAAAAYRISKASEKFLDENRGVNTLLYNLFVWVMSHIPTIKYALETIRPDRARVAASQMKKSVAIALADAIYEGAGVFGKQAKNDS